MYKSLDRMSDEKRQSVQDDTCRFFTAIDANEKV